ncbi:gliding motility-associated C-terminal domain-containing protein [Hymenobacter sp. BRD128]|uniref:gliding motility-associated C-terminal domain-containing protein n=1 Tax=Hymenobacter sp. BRD128 TaxID=2675878 RepID=UPI001564A8ED|nr:gliding motility-associated C-terminal domain-containing protein [Hymenobacter sp. BRD128]QKG58157.1 gliding motility-associated C-terminal domain-containing protein [Hymenobacter sp. BRD128]
MVRNGASFIDSTPRIFPALGDYACLNNLFYYDFGGQDPDGDSLAYDMVTPLNGHSTAANPAPLPTAAPYSTVTWTTGLGTTNQIPGTPPLAIDAHTGRLTVRPSRLGLFVFGVRCSEYRKGVKIGETRRDFQLYVLNCPSNNPPVVTVQANGRLYRAGRDTVRIAPTGPRCLTLRYTDPDPNSVLTLTAAPVNFTDPATAPSFTTTASGTVRASGQPDTLTATLCFPQCADTKGKVYYVNVMVADNGCALPKRDTVRVAFLATPPPSTVPVLTTSFPPEVPGIITEVRVALNQPYTATLLGTDTAPNPLALTAAGEGFDLPSVGMSFAAQNGTGRATANFAWTPTCATATASPNGLLVHFTLTQSGTICTPHILTRTIRFVVKRPADSLAFRPPNIITPNGDGLNDVFTLPDLPPDFCDAQFASVQIFSRWGRLMYQSPDRGFRWSGAAAAGMYFYLITYTDGRKYKGWLEVVP